MMTEIKANIRLTRGKLLLYLTIYSFGLFTLPGCENREANPETGISIGEIHESGEYHFTVIEADGCEYLMLMLDRNHPHEGFGFLAHKGNCSNPIHLYNMEVYKPTEYDSSIIVGRPIKMVPKEN